jgi:hypothetical protein
MSPGSLRGLRAVYPQEIIGSCYLIYVQPAGYNYPTSNPFFEEGFKENSGEGPVRLFVPPLYQREVKDAIDSLSKRVPEGRILVFGECNGSVTGRENNPSTGTESEWSTPVEIIRIHDLRSWWKLHDEGKTFESVIYEITNGPAAMGEI